ncbi:hypothetical protein Tco_0055278, partial [Tanacetum coccineum]
MVIWVVILVNVIVVAIIGVVVVVGGVPSIIDLSFVIIESEVYQSHSGLPLLESAFRYTKVIQDLLSHISRSCPSINNCGPQLIEVIPRKKDKKVSASGSQPSGNTKNDRILQTPSSNSKNKVEDHPRNVKSSLNKRNGTVKVTGSASVQKSTKQDDSDYVCVTSNDCMSSNLCVSNSLNVVKSRAKPKKNKAKKDIWKPTGKVFTQIGYIWRP